MKLLLGMLQSLKNMQIFLLIKNARSTDMKSLINFVMAQVEKKTGVKLELEIVVVE